MIKYQLKSREIFPLGKRESFSVPVHESECNNIKRALEQAEHDLENAIRLLDISKNYFDPVEKNLSKRIGNFLKDFRQEEELQGQ